MGRGRVRGGLDLISNPPVAGCAASPHIFVAPKRVYCAPYEIWALACDRLHGTFILALTAILKIQRLGMDESKANTTMASSSSSSSSSSGGGGSSSSSGTGSKGHVMHANYPMQEPLFYVPPCPSLTKVAEPRPPRRAPVAGYDMKTLRRQVDFLQTEMEEREAVQARLYAQNGELWTYSQSLAEAHARNAALVQAQVSHMHEELQRAHADRYALATQLQRAQESRALLTQLEADLHGARDEHKGIDRLRQEAEAALAGARAENDAHQEMLHRKVPLSSPSSPSSITTPNTLRL